MSTKRNTKKFKKSLKNNNKRNGKKMNYSIKNTTNTKKSRYDNKLLGLDVNNLTEEQKRFLIEDSKTKFNNSLFDDTTIDKWNKILDDKTWLEFSKYGVFTQNEWERVKNQMSIENYISFQKEKLQMSGYDNFFQNFLLGSLCGQEIGTRIITQHFLGQMKSKVINGVQIFDFS